MIPDKIYLPKEEVESRMPWIGQPYEDDPDWDECYIRKEALLKWAKETYLNENASTIRKVCFKQLVEKLLSM